MTDGNELVVYRLKQLEDGQKDQKAALDRLESKLAEIDIELRSYQRVAKILVLIAGLVGTFVGWIAKAMGKA